MLLHVSLFALLVSDMSVVASHDEATRAVVVTDIGMTHRAVRIRGISGARVIGRGDFNSLPPTTQGAAGGF